MDILSLFKGATITIESKGGKRQVWVQAGRQRFPLLNWTDWEGCTTKDATSPDIYPPSTHRTRGKGIERKTRRGR